MNDSMPITPETKIGPLLEAYPDLEQVLIEVSPTYEALRNPVLRRTVANVATLRQVATVGNVPIGTLISRLRCATGQAEGAIDEEEDAPAAPWPPDDSVARSFDARAVIESGGHPMQQVMQELAALAPEGVFELITPFVPAPLIDLARGKGFVGVSRELSPGVVHTRFRRS